MKPDRIPNAKETAGHFQNIIEKLQSDLFLEIEIEDRNLRITCKNNRLIWIRAHYYRTGDLCGFGADLKLTSFFKFGENVKTDAKYMAEFVNFLASEEIKNPSDILGLEIKASMVFKGLDSSDMEYLEKIKKATSVDELLSIKDKLTLMIMVDYLFKRMNEIS